MPIKFHPEPGTILACDFAGLREPEMTKRRPVVVISPRLRTRPGLCAVVPMSTTDPRPVAAYHYRLHTAPRLPAPYSADHHWVKCDMVYTVCFDRLARLFVGKDAAGKRIYDERVVDTADLRAIRIAVLHGLGLSGLTGHL
jgi:mRNA interferase MazF